MIFVENENVTNPRLNLALEEYIVRHFSAENDYLLFYINEPSIIIGKNQITIEEVNQDYIDRNDIHVVRRVSGGGAVYHDFGNLRSEEHTSELQSRPHLVCRLLLEKKKKKH